MSSEGSFSRHATSREKDEYAQGNRYSMAYREQQQQPPPSSQEGMTTHPSVGRFTEKEQANPLYCKKPSVGSTASTTYDGQPLATQSNHGTLSHESSSQSTGGGIVNLRPAPRTDGKLKKSTSKGKK